METEGGYQATEEEELTAIEYELKEVEATLSSLNDRKTYLQQRREKLKDDILLRKSDSLAQRDWSHEDFPWSKELQKTLETKFKINEFRPYQVPTINAVLSKEDVILIMPTGGGKSLCYQLPALVESGLTLVVSPLVSLMEDQLMALQALNINAALLNSHSTKSQAQEILMAMIDKKSPLKLLYVTPEKLAKSKLFMSRLQKAHGLQRLSLIAIDEVHCCSQWGHDFRPDYKFLGLLKPMFPDVPVLGLTATATSKVIADVQKMLSIQGCLVLKASFNRPNLYYEIQPKSSVQKEGIEKLSELLRGRYANQSGIIYATSIKDCEELTSELRHCGLRVGCYHAQLEPEERSAVHAKWASGKYQAVVATIAFGMGIDKPNVRFVIHYSLSKSMENFYQESGRAGRDNQPADCIMFYRFADVFKLSTMVFSQQTGLDNLYGIVNYCLETHRCRRSIIASYFQESWESTDCKAMCDHCRQPREERKVDVAKYCRQLYQLMANAAGNDVKLTGQKLMDAWFGKGPTNLRVKSVPVPALTREAGETIVMHLLTHGYLKEDFHYTAYSTISYFKRGPKAVMALADNHHIMMNVHGSLIPKPICKKPAIKISNWIDMFKSEESSSLTSSSTSRCKMSQKDHNNHKSNHQNKKKPESVLSESSSSKSSSNVHNNNHRSKTKQSNHQTLEIKKLPKQENQSGSSSSHSIMNADVKLSTEGNRIPAKDGIIDVDLDESSNILDSQALKRKVFIISSSDFEPEIQEKKRNTSS